MFHPVVKLLKLGSYHLGVFATSSLLLSPHFICRRYLFPIGTYLCLLSCFNRLSTWRLSFYLPLSFPNWHLSPALKAVSISAQCQECKLGNSGIYKSVFCQNIHGDLPIVLNCVFSVALTVYTPGRYHFSLLQKLT